jgi:carbon monoxide dehydrogenase subunit G
MSEIHKTVTFDAPVEKVFELVDNPDNIPNYIPNVERVADVKRSDGRIGDTFRVIYKVLGISFDEKFTVTGYEPRRKLVSKFDGGMKGTFSWTFEPQGAQTECSMDIEYQVGGGILGKAADALVLERTNEKNMDESLENIRRVLAREKVLRN